MTPLLHDVAESLDGALAHADSLGLFDDLSTFQANRIVIAAELVDRLNGLGYLLVSVRDE